MANKSSARPMSHKKIVIFCVASILLFVIYGQNMNYVLLHNLSSSHVDNISTTIDSKNKLTDDTKHNAKKVVPTTASNQSVIGGQMTASAPEDVDISSVGENFTNMNMNTSTAQGADKKLGSSLDIDSKSSTDTQVSEDKLSYSHTRTEINLPDGNLSCVEPNSKPIIGIHGKPRFNNLSRILNMGFPKCGTSSISKLFERSSFRQAHNHCTKEQFPDCGICFKRNHQKGLTMLDHCGNFNIITQMDYTAEHQCIFPQIQYLDELYHEAPNATWILPFRNVTDWVRSLTNWYKGHSYSLRDRMAMWCDFPELNFHQSHTMKKKSDEDFVTLYCSHVKQIRNFVKKNPSLSLVEFNIEDPKAGEFLASIFPGVDSSDWTQANKSNK